MKRFLLVYGSQTGQSQVISEQIAEKATSKGFKADLSCLDQSGVKVNIIPIVSMLFVHAYINIRVYDTAHIDTVVLLHYKLTSKYFVSCTFMRGKIP